MNKSYRIRTETGDNAPKNIKLKLEQQYDTFDILSLNINQEDLYQAFNCDFGVVVGRVIANGGVGVPNAKVSIFIPLDEDDELDDEIRAIYPYKKPTDKNVNGKRYNLLPRVSEVRKDGSVRPSQPFGSFPTKPEFTTNSSWLEVYKKYYKFTTVTNDSGDYMLFGVPTGIQTVHMSVDITDIGNFSMSPATLINELGYSENLFTDDLKIKESEDLDDLPNIETQEISIDVIPFCGDSDVFDIGITRQDFRIRAQITSTFVVFGSVMNDGENDGWGLYSLDGNVKQHYTAGGSVLDVGNNRVGNILERIYSWKSNLSDTYIDSSSSDPINDMFVLDVQEYSSFKRNGDFCFIVACNRNKVITGENGQSIEVPSDSDVGVFTQFRGFMTFETPDDELPILYDTTMSYYYGIDPNDGLPIEGTYLAPVVRTKQKVPQSSTLGSILRRNGGISNTNWRKDDYTFNAGNVYSVAKFHPTVYNNSTNVVRSSDQTGGIIDNNGFLPSDDINNPLLTVTQNVGLIKTSGSVANDEVEYPNNVVISGVDYFGANWINFNLHMNNICMITSVNPFPNEHLIFPTYYQSDLTTHFRYDNQQPIAADVVNTKGYMRSDLHYTDFINVNVSDIILMNESSLKGFKKSQILGIVGTDYRNGNSPCPINGGLLYPSSSVDPNTYFFKGYRESDCIEFVSSLNVL